MQVLVPIIVVLVVVLILNLFHHLLVQTYYCESGCNDALATWKSDGTLYNSDPLWDGKGCGSSETTCCQRTLIPWFYKSFGYSTTDYIEMRVCCDQGHS